jgi:catalase
VFAANPARGSTDPSLTAVPDPATDNPDPTKIQSFLAAHPEAVRTLPAIAKRQTSSGFASTGRNTYRLINAAGQIVSVQGSTAKAQPFEPVGPAVRTDPYALFDGVLNLIALHPLRWQLTVMGGSPDGPTNRTTVPWLAERPQIDAGIVAVDHVEGEDSLPCTLIHDDPTTLSTESKPSGEPPLSAPSSVFDRSFMLRSQAHNEKPPRAVEPHSHAEGPS